MVTHGKLHYAILKHIIDYGFAPDVATLCKKFNCSSHEMVEMLKTLQEYHGVVLHPNEAKIWVIHPFSLAPTNFYVKSSRGAYWGNCAWCSLGVAALLKEDVTITTTIGAHDEQVVIHITHGEVEEKDLYIHFPIPMKNAWHNVIYTCSNMLVFRNEEQITQWSTRHNIPKGDVQPIKKIWEFSKEWYGNHLNPQWEKWTMEEAKAIFMKYALTGEIWNLESTAERF